jgi:hypothetical protein
MAEWEAIEHGHVDCMRIFPGNSRHETTACARAASDGDLEMLRFLYENGWKWCAHTCGWAVAGGNEACLAYALSHGCPHERRDIYRAVLHGMGSAVAQALQADHTDPLVHAFALMAKDRQGAEALLHAGWPESTQGDRDGAIALVYGRQ